MGAQRLPFLLALFSRIFGGPRLTPRLELHTVKALKAVLAGLSGESSQGGYRLNLLHNRRQRPFLWRGASMRQTDLPLADISSHIPYPLCTDVPLGG